MLAPLFNHLWQSTLFAAVAGLLTLALRKNHARVRHGVWLAASVKFLIPISLLIALGNALPRQTAQDPMPSGFTVAMDQVSQPFTAPRASLPILSIVTPPEPSPLPAVLLSVWACGFLGIGWSWLVRWRRIRAMVLAGSARQLEISVPAIFSPATIEPGVFGIFRPVLLLPEGITDRLTPTQLKAVIAHELCHIRCRDNLIAAVHMFVETLFWFHPVVWWIGKRMVEERERACDEEVLRLGSEPRVYAEGILNVCRLYTESQLQCVSGITGPNLRKRVGEIMTNRMACGLSGGRKILLAVAGVLAIAAPVVIGMMAPHLTRAQAAVKANLKFEVTSVKPANPDGGSKLNCMGGKGFVAWNQTLLGLMQWSYDLQYGEKRVFNGPPWLDSPGSRFEVQGKVARPVSFDECRAMVRSLLADRFGLVLHKESRELPVYVLSVDSKGPKIHHATDDPKLLSQVSLNGASIQVGDGYHQTASGRGMSMLELARFLGGISSVGRLVIDKTELPGFYGFGLEYSEAQGDVSRPDLFTAVREQLGLRLEARKAPVEVLVIDHVEKPSEN
jgi:bla regulator protein BlaR1